MGNKGVFIFIFLLLSISLAYAQPPFDATQVTGEIVLSHTPLSSFPADSNLTFTFGVYNTTGLFLGNDTTDCLFMLHQATGTDILDIAPTFNISMFEWFVFVDSTYLSNNQDYQYSVYCNTTGLGGEIREAFQVTTGGREPGNPGANEAVIILLPILFCLLLLYTILKMGEEHTTLKLFLLLFIPPSFWAAMNIATEIVVEFYPNWDSFIELLAFYTEISGYIAAILFSYLFIWFIKHLFDVAAQKKKEKMEY